MQEHKIILTWEAIYDITGITDYIEYEFGKTRADRFRNDIRKELEKYFEKKERLYISR